MSLNKCKFGTVNELHEYFRANDEPILNDLVRQGRLTGWGVLEHQWGDEWNYVIYYTARDLPTFDAAFVEYFGRLQQRDPKVLQTLDRYCTEHKDNIYTNVMQSARPR